MFDSKKILLTVIGLLLSLLMMACQEAEPTPAAAPAVDPAVELVVIAEGELLPADERRLAFEVGGVLTSLFVEEGDWVEQGTLLAVLGESSQLEAQQAALELELLTAQQALEDLNLTAEVKREQAWQAVLDAREAVDAAQKSFDEFDQDDYKEDLEQAQEEVIEARQAVKDAQEALADYQDLDPQNATRKRYEDALEQAENKLNEKQREINALQTDHDRVKSQFLAAQAALLVAEEQYSKRKDGPDVDATAQVTAQIDSIESQLTAVEQQISKMTLTAPLDGEVAVVYSAEGEFLPPGVSAILLADTRQWVVETTDLTEIEVVRLSIGQSVLIEPEAFPGETFHGTVEEISTSPTFKQGDVLYTVRITIEADELPEMRWGMTLILTFE